MTPRMGEVLVADLKRRSEKGLELAKQVMKANQMDQQELRDAFEHYVEHWNDFTHAGFFSISCEAVGGRPENAVRTQAAIAMMAAAFDIHDDIIDKSAEKNGVPTVYGKFGVEVALLLGNAFLIEGFRVFSDSLTVLTKEKEKSTLETTKKLLFEVGNAHALEVGLKKRKNLTPNNYLQITEMKAAAIEADMHLGALLGGGDEAEVAVMARLGRILGILATLRDDLVDVFDVEELSQRILAQDLPLPLLFAMQDAENGKIAARLAAKSKLTKTDIAKLVDVTLEAATVVQIKVRMQLLIEEGLSLANKLPKTKLLNKLQALLSFMLEDL